MLAARIHRFGAPDVIEIEEVPRPEPGPNEVLVRVLAAGVGPWDAWVRSGKSRIDQPLPLTLGSDIAGRVEAVGDAVRGFNLGDMVYGITNERFTGGYAEYASASADSIAPSPAGLGAGDAASVPVVAVTAQQMLFEHGQLSAGQRVLIHGAGGSVGAYAVQLAKAAGAEVVGTDRGGGLDYARSLAPHMVDAAADDFAALGPFDLVVDTVGGDGLQHRSMDALKTGGRLISSVNKPDEEVAKRHGVDARFILVHVTRTALSEVARLLESGSLLTRVGAVLPLRAAREAHDMLEGRRTRPPGKIVLTTTDDSL